MAGKGQPLGKQFPVVNEDGTPTEYFIRWAQERQIDISGGITLDQAQALIDEWSAEREIFAGTGLTGGGALDEDVTISLDASLDNLNDVDLTVPPTDNQVLGWSDSADAWVPVTQSGGGGGGGMTPPTMVQKVDVRNDATFSMPATPTAGNLLVWVTAGFSQSLLSYKPFGFSFCGWYTSDANNGVALWIKRVQAGDANSFSVSASDNQCGVMYEFSGSKGTLPGSGYYTPVSGTTWYHTPSCMPGTVTIFALENDTNGNITVGPATGLTFDYSPTDSANHKGLFARLDDTFNSLMSGTVASPLGVVSGHWTVLGT